MENDTDRIVAGILRADDLFLMEVGRLTLLFSSIEDRLVNDAQDLLELISNSNKEMYKDAVSNMAKLRMLEKRDLLTRLCGEIGRFYQVDHSRVAGILAELGNLNRFRRAAVHGSIRWLAREQKPAFVDSHGHSFPAWPHEVADLNLKVLNWVKEYCSEQAALMRSVMRAYAALADRLLRRPTLPASIQELLQELKARATAGE